MHSIFASCISHNVIFLVRFLQINWISFECGSRKGFCMHTIKGRMKYSMCDWLVLSYAIYFIDRTFIASLHPLSLIPALVCSLLSHTSQTAAQWRLYSKYTWIECYNNNKRIASVSHSHHLHSSSSPDFLLLFLVGFIFRFIFYLFIPYNCRHTENTIHI